MRTLQLQFPIHTNERTAETTAYVRSQTVRLGSNCKKLLQYWQKNNIPLSEDGARLFIGVKNIAQRVADLKHKKGVVILDRWDSSHTFKLYYLGCTCAAPKHDTTGCYLHSEKLKV